MQPPMFLYDKGTGYYIRKFDVFDILTTIQSESEDFSSFNRLERFFFQKLLFKLLNLKLVYMKNNDNSH